MKVNVLLSIGFGSAILAGCVSVPEDAGFPDVQRMVAERIPHRVHWHRGTPADGEIRDFVRTLLKKPLTPEAAVQVALLNNRSLQAEYEELGVAQADLVQAGLLQNPVIFGGVGLPNESPKRAGLGFGVAFSFIDLLILPARQQVASAHFEEMKLRTAKAVLDLSADVKADFYAYVAARQTVEMRQVVAATALASSDLAKALHDAGNISELRLSTERAHYEKERIEWLRAQAELVPLKERLTRLMGLYGKDALWTAVDRLPDIPGQEVPLAHLESYAIQRRLDLAATLKERDALASSLGIVEDFWWLGGFEVGVESERETDGQWIIGPAASLELPIFDQGQAASARGRALLRMGEQKLSALAIDIRSEVRALRDRLLTTRRLARHYIESVIPLRERIVALTLRRYNFMLIGAFEVLEAKEEEADAYQQYIEIVRDYWLHQTELERAVGGSLPPSESR